MNSSICTGRLWSNQLSNQSNFSALPSWRVKYLSPKEIFWFPLLSQDYLVIQIGWLWLDLNTKKWFARPNLSLIKNGWYYHYQWQINYQLRPNMRKCPILGIYFAWLHCWTAFLRMSYPLMCSTSCAVSLRTQLTVKQCCMISTDSIYIILLLLTFIIIKVIIFRYFNIIIILVIANYREIESPSNLQHHTILQMSAFPWLSHRKSFYQMMSSNANSLECTSLLISGVTRILEFVEFNGLKI